MSDRVVLITSHKPCEDLIGRVYELKNNGFEVVVVDDGSGENFSYIFKEISTVAYVFSYDKNIGKGYATKLGLSFIEYRFKWDYVVVTFDSSENYDISEIEKMAELAEKNQYSIILNQPNSFKAKYRGAVSRLINRLKSGMGIYALNIPIKAFSQRMSQYMIEIKGKGLDYDVNMLIKCTIDDINIIEDNRVEFFKTA